jgi:iron complex transport system substrate-binding protein
MTRSFPPERIVCLTEETVETLYLLGQQHRIVGVSGYAVRPPEVRRDKPRVSAYTSADLPKVMALEPDLALTFSDLQADIAAALIREGVAVHAFNQRDVAGILAMVRMLGALTSCASQAEALACSLAARLDAANRAAAALPRRPRVYFEEWDEPMISSIGWVSEIITAAGGDEVFAEKASQQAARDRIVTLDEVITARPDIVIASWCGKKFAPARFVARPGFEALPAVQAGELHEIKAPLILQPGPAALTDGLDAIASVIRRWALRREDSG